MCIRDRLVYCDEEDINLEDESLNVALTASSRTSENDPETFKEAMNSQDYDKWIEAMIEELKSHHTNKTWEIIPLNSLPQNASL